MLVGGNLTQLAASLGTPYRVRPAGRLRAVPRGRERAAVPARPPVDAAAPGRYPRRGPSAIVFGEFPGCDEPGDEPASRATRWRPLSRDVRRAGAVRISLRAHARSRRDAAARRPRARHRRQPRRRSSSRKLRVSRGVSCEDSPDWHRRHRDGHAGGDAEAPGSRRPRLRPGRLSADEHVPGRGAHRDARRLRRPSTSRPTSTSSSSATRSRAATPRSRRCSTGRSGTARCPRPCREHFLLGRAVDRHRRHARQDDDHGDDRVAADRGGARPEPAGRRHRRQLRRRRIELPDRPGPRLRHRGRRVRQRVLRQDGEVPQVPAGHRGHRQHRVRPRRHLRRPRRDPRWRFGGW